MDRVEGRVVVPNFLKLLGRLSLLFEAPPPRADLYLDLLDIVAAERLWLSHNGGPWANVSDEDRSLLRHMTVALQVRLERLLDEMGPVGEDVGEGADQDQDDGADVDAIDPFIQGYAIFVHRLVGSQGSLPVVPGAPVH